ncbi:iron (metal) dependent repressor, DtxR family [Desulfobulbus propionicus DSM 2032]|jgi:DtxR family Mn-dependent transcriptional regulator|uniref:Transcriptional regulator MntR n=1 Tax=Desulfobulbus propionicus (strain ATCC 33891 / DSM 2032 / VKM B-1956 / 1pr3) TaxID=577650 RepID=A0A7U3YK33_DESPD|nr:metal-dependent transcriptional regulator [Desulfobulbus propionicus]ADW16844.1 iron (metal) dependent repressor, DtxR family [Desulfobulbus propionicus DSM 2032]
MEPQQLSASLEDYIEAIYHIISEKQVARGKDISARLSVSGASVTEALRALSKKGLINYAPYEVITLTDDGRVIAEDVIRRHNSLKQFFTNVLAIDEPLAEEGACKIEHTAPPQIINRMVEFIKFLDICPRGGKDLISGFANYCREGRTPESCASCILHCMDNTTESSTK